LPWRGLLQYAVEPFAVKRLKRLRGLFPFHR
jgi:hypothetical protein